MDPAGNLPGDPLVAPVSIPSPTGSFQAPVIHPSDSDPDICDNLSELSDFSDASEVKQTIDHAASSSIGRSFLASYNRSDILKLRIPQPMHTIETIQLLGKQARLVLVSSFLLGASLAKMGKTHS